MPWVYAFRADAEAPQHPAPAKLTLNELVIDEYKHKTDARGFSHPCTKVRDFS